MRFAVYLRVSTSEQASPGHVSLEVQEAVCKEAVSRAGGTVVSVLKDVQSGLEVRRPQYQKLLRMAAEGETDAIISYRLDRLGRDAAELLQIFKDARRYGITIQSATEPLENSLMAGILALLAEDESRRISVRVTDALAARVKAGKSVNRAPLGYSLVQAHGGQGRTLEPNDDAPKVVRLFALYASGRASLKALMEESALLGLGGPYGLSRSYLRRILRSPVYIGQSVSRRRGKDTDNRVRQRPREEWLTAPGLHPAIVDEEVFHQVQGLLDRHRDAYGQVTKGGHLLTGLIICGRCGRHMTCRIAKKGNSARRYYKCNGRLESRPGRTRCTQPQITARVAEPYVKEQITTTFAITADIRALAEDILNTHREDYLGTAAARKLQLERSQAQHESDRRRLALEFARGRIAEDVYADLEGQLTAALKIVGGELAQVEDVPTPDIGAALEYISRIDWADLEGPDWIEAANALINKVVVTDRIINVRWTEEAEGLARALTHAGEQVGVR